MNETLGKSTTGLHRRTVLKGAAWSVPVVAAAVAVPAYAASGCADYTVSGGVTPGANGTFAASFGVNKLGVAQPLSGWGLVVDIVVPTGSTVSVPAQPGITVNTSTPGIVKVTATGSAATTLSFNGTFTGAFSGSVSWTKLPCTTNSSFSVSAETFSLVASKTGPSATTGNSKAYTMSAAVVGNYGTTKSLSSVVFTANPNTLKNNSAQPTNPASGSTVNKPNNSGVVTVTGIPASRPAKFIAEYTGGTTFSIVATITPGGASYSGTFALAY